MHLTRSERRLLRELEQVHLGNLAGEQAKVRIRKVTGLDERQLLHAYRLLHDLGLIDGVKAGEFYGMTAVTASGRQYLRQHAVDRRARAARLGRWLVVGLLVPIAVSIVAAFAKWWLKL